MLQLLISSENLFSLPKNSQIVFVFYRYQHKVGIQNLFFQMAFSTLLKADSSSGF